MKSLQKVIFFITLSLVAHQLLYIGLEYRKATLESQLLRDKLTALDKLIEFKLEPATNKKRHKVVTDTNTGKKVKKKNANTLFQSRFNKVVNEETVARHTGATINRKKSANTNKSKDTKNNKLDKSEFGYFKASQKTSGGYSTISEYIPNVKRGGFTSLNTNQFVYYAFFNRINNQIRSRWTDHLSFLGQRLEKPRLAQLANKDHITNITAIITPDGKLQKVIITKSSGYKETDWAVTEAFVRAAPLLNPPAGLVESDGLIRLEYSFHLTWQSQGFGQG